MSSVPTTYGTTDRALPKVDASVTEPCKPSPLREQWKAIAVGLAVYALLFALPLGWERFDRSLWR
ncbi:MAG: hypothetical protein KJ000_19035 [Pirellulaceae bacterium]|nr:hypothetical protein [Pirellulaceae bacterium]